MDLVWNENTVTFVLGGSSYEITHAILIAFVICFLIACLIIYIPYKAINAHLSRKCRWHQISERGRSPFTKWQCKTCRMEAYSTDDLPPKECKRVLRNAI